MGEMIVMIAAALLLVPVAALVLAIVALVRVGRVEKRLTLLRGLSGTEGPATAPVPRPVPPPVGRPTAAPAPVPPRPALLPPAPRVPRPPLIDWEKFTAVKLMSWIGGFTLFLGAVFFAKYSIDNGWLTPLMRVMAGFVLGAAAVVLGLKLHRRYDVTGQTLAAAGAASLYAVAFAAHALYGFLGPVETFGFLALVTVLAFLLAARMDSRYIGLLALLGGFLVPPLVSTGVDNPLGLFGYITLLVLGLWALVAVKGWGFLWFLGAAGTGTMIAGWWFRFPGPHNVPVATGVFLWFTALFGWASYRFEKRNKDNPWTDRAAGGLPLFVLALAGVLLGSQGGAPGSAALMMGALFGADAAVAAFALRRPHGHRYYVAAGILTFVFLLSWTETRFAVATLPVGLTAFLLFGVAHGALALVFDRRGAPAGSRILSGLFPVALLLPLTLGLLKDLTVSALVWPVLFGLNLVALVVAVATGFVAAALGALILTFFSIYSWIPRLAPGGLPEMLAVVGVMAALFSGVAYVVFRRSTRSAKSAVPGKDWPVDALRVFPVLAGALPYVLLATAAMRLRPGDPASLFAVAVLVTVLLLGVLAVAGESAAGVALVALGGVGFVQFAWHAAAFTPASLLPSLGWATALAAGFLLLPFLGGPRFARHRFVWMAAALAAPVHFALHYRALSAVDPGGRLGLLPAAWAVVALLVFAGAFRRLPVDAPHRQSLLALFGAVALFFITLIFPLQFDKEWLTLGWALEGVALLWLNRRVPHPGLKAWSLGLLSVAFARLALNPAVFGYHPRAGTRILNWYLYAYGAVAACAFVAARLWPRGASEPRRWERRAPGLLAALGTVLLFLLLNIEIADFFSDGAALTFNLRGSLAQDLAYTLGWGLFGLGLIGLGLVKRLKAAQWSGLALLGVTIGKLYIHDVWRLPTLFRSAAFAGLAVMLILGSFLFQHFQSRKEAVRE